MTIRIEVTNPAEHQPSELRAVATFLNNLAADREAGRIEHVPAYRSTGSLSVGSHEVPAAAPLVSARQTTTVVPGASSQSETEPDADASAACDISQLDSEGIKWDERIHSETKSQNKDGTWRLRRGVDKALVDQVIAAQQQQEDDTPPPPPAEDAAPYLPPEAPAEDDTPPPADDDVKPADVIKFISSNKLEAATVNAMAEQLGMARAADLFTKPQLAGQLLELLKPLVA